MTPIEYYVVDSYVLYVIWNTSPVFSSSSSQKGKERRTENCLKITEVTGLKDPLSTVSKNPLYRTTMVNFVVFLVLIYTFVCHDIPGV